MKISSNIKLIIASILFYVFSIFITKTIENYILLLIIFFYLNFAQYYVTVHLIFKKSEFKIALYGILAINLALLLFEYLVKYEFTKRDVLSYYISKYFLLSCFLILLWCGIKFITKTGFALNKVIYLHIYTFVLISAFYFIILNISYFHYRFYASGNKFKLVSFNIKGYPNGEYKKWDRNGNLVYEGMFENGYKIGAWRKFDSIGNTVDSTMYILSESSTRFNNY